VQWCIFLHTFRLDQSGVEKGILLEETVYFAYGGIISNKQRKEESITSPSQ
jgi:hypothetical protein